jgi:hypothetical protein
MIQKLWGGGGRGENLEPHMTTAKNQSLSTICILKAKQDDDTVNLLLNYGFKSFLKRGMC